MIGLMFLKMNEIELILMRRVFVKIKLFVPIGIFQRKESCFNIYLQKQS